jgi:putative hydrolase of the HAD superfamily
MVKAIFFDLGGVLVTEVFRIFGRWLAGRKNIPIEKFRELVRPHWLKYRLGEIDGIDFMQGVIGDLGIDADPEELLDYTCSMMAVDDAVLSMVKRLKSSGRYKLGVISNNSFEWSAHAKETLGLSKYFDVWVVSCDVSLAKPEPDIYEYSIDKLGMKPGDCVFIDDKQVNIDSSSKLGMRALLFTDAAKLESDLKGLGVYF